MVRNTRPVPARHHAAANEERIRAGDLKSATMDSDRYVPIWEQQGNKKTAYGAGVGPDDRRRGQGWADLDLQNSVPGAIDGKLRWEVYDDPEQENLIAYSTTFRTENLRSATNDSRTEKVLMPGMQPLAGDDSYVVLAIKADSGNDGDTLTPGNCSVDVGVPYSRYK